MSLSSVAEFNLLGPAPDKEATIIANLWHTWKTNKRGWEDECSTRRDYIFATSTRTTENNKLPWRNSTTTPKLCQIRDNLHSNYMAALFPNEDWLSWEGSNEDAVEKEVRRSIEAYIKDKLEAIDFKNEMSRLLYDYIDYGNCYAAVEYVTDFTTTAEGEHIPKYSGPIISRISPYDIAFDITASTFQRAPKIVRSVVSIGQLQADADRLVGGNAEDFKLAVEKLRIFKSTIADTSWEDFRKITGLKKDGFDEMRAYASNSSVEILTFYGDIYIPETDTLLKDHKITVMDRRYVLSMEPIDSLEGSAPIHHVGWRQRPDNLIAMGPLDNLVGLQYRIDHLENLRGDMMDMTAFPMIKVKGDSVEDFNFGPNEQIHMDADDDVDFLHPDTTALNADLQIARYMEIMEEMAGSPKQAMGFRTPGEKTAFEVQVLENAAGRIFQNKIRHFEEIFMEPLINSTYSESIQKSGAHDKVRMVDSDTGAVDFRDIPIEDLKHSGRLRPVGARHFIEKAQAVQNLQQLFNSPLANDNVFLANWSPYQLALATEDLLNLRKYGMVSKNVRVAEEAELAAMTDTASQQVQREAMTDVEEP